MQFPKVIALAASAIAPALAAPGGVDASGSLLAVRGGGGGSCPGDQLWVGWDKTCLCPNKECEYDSSLSKCHYAPHPQPSCGYGEVVWCARSSTDYCQWDVTDERCWDDGSTQVFCCAPAEVPTKAPEVCPPSHPSCPADQHWDYTTSQCECEKGKVWLNNKCCFPPIPKPSCSYGEQAYCAKDATHFCAYDDTNDYCQDDGHNIAFCCAPPQIEDTCNKKWN